MSFFFFLKKRNHYNYKDECIYNYVLSLQTILSQDKKKILNYVTYNRYTISTFQSMYKAEKKKGTMSTIRNLYKAEKESV